MRIVVGTRGSPLAVVQTEAVLELLRRRHPNVEFVVKEIRTQGDIAGEAPLAKLPRGIFAKELENALARGEIDMAVHSFKDLPTDLDAGFSIAAIGRREDPRDVLVTPDRRTLAELPEGSRLGTSSPRRRAQLMNLCPQAVVLPIRGSVDTRLDKAKSDEYDGAVLAAAGLIRLGRTDEIAEYLSAQEFVPPPGQGALAVEIRNTPLLLL